MRAEGPTPDPLAPSIEALRSDGRLRVWSLVVTVFGDAVAPRGGRIAAARIAELTARIGVGEGALRTALSRLVADGTLEREREGRASFHRLSARAGAEVLAASAVIYAPPAGRDGWTMGAGPAPPRALELPGGAWLSTDPAPEGAVAVTGRLLDTARVEPGAAHRRALDRLDRDLDALGRLIEAGGGASGPGPLDAMAARTLLIHRWRRIALRWPDLPAEDGGAAGRVAAAYRALLPASEAWLDGATASAAVPGGARARGRVPSEGRFGSGLG